MRLVSEFLPRLSRGAEAFYDPVRGEMGPSFVVHMELLRALRDEIAFVVTRSEILLERVRGELERLR